jgi:hypothetical protein
MKSYLSLLGLLILTSCVSPERPPSPVRSVPVISPKDQGQLLTVIQAPSLPIPAPPDTDQWLVMNFPAVSKTYTVYQRDSLASGTWSIASNVSTSSASFLIDKTVTSRFFKVVPDVPSVTLTWNQSTDTNTVGYRVYWGPQSRSYTNAVDAGSSNRVAVSLTKGGFYHFAATAYNFLNMESDFSDEVTYAAPTDEGRSLPVVTSIFPSLPVAENLPATNITSTAATLGGRIVDSGGAVSVAMFFLGTEDPSSNTNADWQSIRVVGTNVSSAPVWLAVTNLTPGTTYYFAFSARNATGRAEGRPVLSFTTSNDQLLTSTLSRSGRLGPLDRQRNSVLFSPKGAVR